MRKPPWLRVPLGGGDEFARVRALMKGHSLHTVCEEAACPNQGRCWAKGRATVMILGGACTRGCRFCDVASKPPGAPDADEPRRVADAVVEMNLQNVVITSVTRDDLPDGGAAIWAETIRAVHDAAPDVRVEVLAPDFGGDAAALDLLLDARPRVFGHNLETVRRMYPAVRPQASYDRSLQVLARAHAAGLITKTGIMAGVGETDEEIEQSMHDALRAGCDIFYAGQYLQPSREHLPVDRYVTPETFDAYRRIGKQIGFAVVVSAPLVRSSYHAEEQEQFVEG